MRRSGTMGVRGSLDAARHQHRIAEPAPIEEVAHEEVKALEVNLNHLPQRKKFLAQ